MLHLKYPKLTVIHDLLVGDYFPIKASAFRDLVVDRTGSESAARNLINYMRNKGIIGSVGSTNNAQYEWYGEGGKVTLNLDEITECVCQIIDANKLSQTDILKLTDHIKMRSGLYTKRVSGIFNPKYQDIAHLFHADNFPVKSSVFKNQIKKVRDCSYRTAVAVCMDLLHEGVLSRKGDGRGTYYNLVVDD